MQYERNLNLNAILFIMNAKFIFKIIIIRRTYKYKTNT